MSETPVDMSKVSQMLDNGWDCVLYRNSLGSYTAKCINGEGKEFLTDDFSPEQALTRLAYKVTGEIL